jgi:chorismate mutase/prephenate dehydratase
MENQHNKHACPALLSLREEIDNIDNQIIELLGQRMQVVHEVGQLKKDKKETFFIKSSREADMIKDLIAKSDPKLPKTAVINIWRKIITSANMYEQPLHIAIHNPNNVVDYAYLVKDYYNVDVPVSMHDSVANIVLAIEKGEAQIGIFVLPQDDKKSDQDWWINLANNKLGIKIFAKIPFITLDDKAQNIELVAVAIKKPEQSKEDNSLIYIEVGKEVRKDEVVKALKKNNPSPNRHNPQHYSDYESQYAKAAHTY